MRTTFILAVASLAFGLTSPVLGPALAAGGGGGGGGSSEIAPAKPVDPSFAQGRHWSKPSATRRRCPIFSRLPLRTRRTPTLTT